MKILVIGDSHGNIANLKHVVGFAKKIKAGAVIHTGDWDNGKSLKTVYDSGIKLFTVIGNADAGLLVDENYKNIKQVDKDLLYGIFTIGGRKIGVIHSFKASDTWYLNCDIVFCGHRHSQDERIVKGVKVVRPGALKSDIEFCVYDTEKNGVEFVKI